MKYTIPTGCARLSHAGQTVTIAGDNSVDLDPAAARLLAPHGIVPVGDPAPIDLSLIAGMSHVDLVTALSARNVAVPTKSSDAALRGLLRQALASPPR